MTIIVKNPHESRILSMSDERLSRMEERLLIIFKRPKQMDADFKRFHARVDEL